MPISSETITYNGSPIRHHQTQYGGSRVYIGGVSDCFNPPLILVLGDDFADAYENLLLHPIVRQSTMLTEPDLADYPPDELQYNAEGEPVDSSAVFMFQVAGEPDL